MSVRDVQSFVAGNWVSPDASARKIASAVTGKVIARAGNAAPDVSAMLDHAREIGGPALRGTTFHQRARMLKALAQHLNDHKETLYDLSYDTGATLADHRIDIDGGIGTLFAYASRGRRELPDGSILTEGAPERLSRGGSFQGLHVCTPLRGVAVQINAFNFPVWGMLEKLAPALLAGMPAIVKPATSSCYVAEAAVRLILDSGILPQGALQLICGPVGDLLNRLNHQDVVGFTGSAQTALQLRSNPAIAQNAVRFTAEQDSLNAAILGPDCGPGTPEFDLFLSEVHREMTVKAGQKCTAIRRIIVPDAMVPTVIEALRERLGATRIGDPRDASTEMGPLISQDQRRDVLRKVALIAQEATRVCGDPANFTVHGADEEKGAFLPPMLFSCSDPDNARHIHGTEAFGPVATVMGYRDPGHAIALANKGGGSLVVSVITGDGDMARKVVAEAGANHGRIYFNNRHAMAESTGHGSPLPNMIHGGPGRAGGGEELGGIRAVKHYMQRTAIQGSPDILTSIGGAWVPGSTTQEGPAHPFTRHFDDLQIGETLETGMREITLDDIDHFAHFTGDTFYAHMDDDAARRNPFFPGRVAHGYLLLSFAAGLFVDPGEGPVLANTGLDGLRFLKPVAAGDAIFVRLTVKAKTPRNPAYGEVRWHVSVLNRDGDRVAEYDLLTMNAIREQA